MRKQRKLKTMKKLLNLIMMPIILFISITTVGCGAKDNYVEGYGEDEYIEYSDSEYYEEPQETKISDKEINKLLKKYPDQITQPEEFAKKAFITEQIDTVDESFANLIATIIMQSNSYNNLAVHYDPNMFLIGIENEWRDEKTKKDRVLLKIQKYKSIFQLEEYETENNTIYQYFMNSNNKNISISGQYSYLSFYYLILAVEKPNKKIKTIWEKIYISLYNTIEYRSETTTNRVWTNKMLEDHTYCEEYFKKYLSDYKREKLLENYNNNLENIKFDYNKDIKLGVSVKVANDYSNKLIDGYSNHFYKFYETSYKNLFNDNYDWSKVSLPDNAAHFCYELPNWNEIIKPYQKDQIKYKEYLFVNIANAYNFGQDTLKIFVDYAYNNKLPK